MRPLLWITVPSNVTAFVSSTVPEDPTFDFLALLVTDVLGDRHVIADECASTGMLNCLLHRAGVLETVNRKSSALGEVAILFLDGSDLNGIERDESRLSSSLVAHVLDAFDRDFLVIDDDGVDVATQNSAHGEVVLLLGGFAQVDHPPVDAGEHPLEIGQYLAKLGFTLILPLVCASREQLAENILELFVEFGLFDADVSGVAECAPT